MSFLVRKFLFNLVRVFAFYCKKISSGALRSGHIIHRVLKKFSLFIVAMFLLDFIKF